MKNTGYSYEIKEMTGGNQIETYFLENINVILCIIMHRQRGNQMDHLEVCSRLTHGRQVSVKEMRPVHIVWEAGGARREGTATEEVKLALSRGKAGRAAPDSPLPQASRAWGRSL